MLPAALIDSLPARTTFQHRSDGFQLNMPATLSGTGTPRAMVRVRNYVRPIVPVGVVFAGLRKELGFSPPERKADTPVATLEAECAALHHVVEGERSLSIGMVYGEDFYRLIIGHGDQVMSTAVEHVVERMTTHLPLGLAYRRRRFYWYAPPPGWGGHLRHRLVAEWLAPRFPNQRAVLTVFPARPFSESPTGVMDRHLHEMGWGGYAMESVQDPEMLQISERLTGVRWRPVGAWLDGARMFTEVVALHDGTFLYMIRLDHDGQTPEAHRAVLDTVVQSVRPIPPLSVAPLQSVLAFMAE